MELESENELEEQFGRATDFVARNHNKEELSKDLLKLYGFYKQATSGKCDTKRPGIFQLTAKAKWDAWNSLDDLPKNKAMENYIDLLTELIPDWDKGQKKDSWVSVSTPAIPFENIIPDSEKIITDFIKEGDLDNFRNSFNDFDGKNELDEDGLGLIHWAADRNRLEILEYILQDREININLQDSDGQTALHYVSSCGHIECLALLLTQGADKTIKNTSDESAFDVALDQNVSDLLK